MVAFAKIAPFSSSQKEIAHWLGPRPELAKLADGVVAIVVARSVVSQIAAVTCGRR